MIENLLQQLKTAEELGTFYLRDNLTDSAPSPSVLEVQSLAEPAAKFGRGPRGWSLPGGLKGGYTTVRPAGKSALGNRSLFSQISFCSTQQGVEDGQHGMFELVLSPGSTEAGIGAKVRAGCGVFYITDEDSGEVLAGSATHQVFRQSVDTIYTLSALLFAKGVFATLSGPDIPGGKIEVNVYDRERFVPGRPGFAIEPNENATGGEAVVSDWLVTPVGPYRCKLGVIGDSLTAGLDSEPEEESYVYLVTQELGQSLVLNTGGGGANTGLDLGRFPYEIAPFEPEIVWIEGGTNDLGRGDSADLIFSNMMRQAELVNWGGKVVLSTVSPRCFEDARGYGELICLNELIRRSGYAFVDRHRILCDESDPRHIHPRYICSDGVHFNPGGHQAVAEAALRVMRGVLQESYLVAL